MVTANGATKTSPRRKYRTSRRTVLSLLAAGGDALAGAVLTWGVVGCAHGGPLPGPSYVAPGSTPEPVHVEGRVAVKQAAVRDRVARVLVDSAFHLTGVERSALSAYSLTRLTKVRVDVLPSGGGGAHARDSSVVVVTGEMYVGDATRRDSISALPERWRLITASDGAAQVLRTVVRSLEVLPADAAAPLAPTVVRRPDAKDSALLAATPVGRTVDLCTPTALPAGWLVLYWYTDHSRCRGLTHEPNVMRVEREW